MIIMDNNKKKTPKTTDNTNKKINPLAGAFY